MRGRLSIVAAALAAMPALANWPVDGFERGGRAWLAAAYSAAVERAEAAGYETPMPEAPNWLDYRIQRSYLAYLKGYLTNRLVAAYVAPATFAAGEGERPVEGWPIMWTAEDLLSAAGLDASFWDTPWRGLNTNGAAGWPALRAMLDLLTVSRDEVWEYTVEFGRSDWRQAGDYFDPGPVGDVPAAWAAAVAAARSAYEGDEPQGPLTGLPMGRAGAQSDGTNVFAWCDRQWGRASSRHAHAGGGGGPVQRATNLQAVATFWAWAVAYGAWHAQGSGFAESNWVQWDSLTTWGLAVTSAVAAGAADLRAPVGPGFPGGPAPYFVLQGYLLGGGVVLFDWTATEGGFRYRAGGGGP